MNKLEIAQLAVELTVAAVVQKTVANTLVTHTNTNDTVVKVASGMAGVIVSGKLKPLTDDLTEKAYRAVARVYSRKNH